MKLTKYICNLCEGISCKTETIHYNGPVGCACHSGAGAEWRDAEPDVPTRMAAAFDYHHESGGYYSISFECPGCKGMEECAKHERDVNKALDEECREKSKEIEQLKRALVAHLGDVGQVQSEAERMASIQDSLMADQAKEIAELKIAVENRGTAAYLRKAIDDKDKEIERLKEAAFVSDHMRDSVRTMEAEVNRLTGEIKRGAGMLRGQDAEIERLNRELDAAVAMDIKRQTEIDQLHTTIERALEPIHALRGRCIGYADDVLYGVQNALEGGEE